MQTVVINQIDASEFRKAIAEETRLQILTTYASVNVSTQTVCEIWGISSHTLTRYVKRGIIEVAGKDGAFNMFSLADVLLGNPKYKRFQQ